MRSHPFNRNILLFGGAKDDAFAGQLLCQGINLFGFKYTIHSVLTSTILQVNTLLNAWNNGTIWWTVKVVDPLRCWRYFCGPSSVNVNYFTNFNEAQTMLPWSVSLSWYNHSNVSHHRIRFTLWSWCCFTRKNMFADETKTRVGEMFKRQIDAVNRQSKERKSHNMGSLQPFSSIFLKFSFQLERVIQNWCVMFLLSRFLCNPELLSYHHTEACSSHAQCASIAHANL